MTSINEQPNNKIKINLIDRIRSYSAKPIGEDPSVLEDALGRIISLHGVKSLWAVEGMFIDVPFWGIYFLKKKFTKIRRTFLVYFSFRFRSRLLN